MLLAKLLAIWAGQPRDYKDTCRYYFNQKSFHSNNFCDYLSLSVSQIVGTFDFSFFRFQKPRMRLHNQTLNFPLFVLDFHLRSSEYTHSAIDTVPGKLLPKIFALLHLAFIWRTNRWISVEISRSAFSSVLSGTGFRRMSTFLSQVCRNLWRQFPRSDLNLEWVLWI